MVQASIIHRGDMSIKMILEVNMRKEKTIKLQFTIEIVYLTKF